MSEFNLVPIKIMMEFAEEKNFSFTDQEFSDYVNSLPYTNRFEPSPIIDSFDSECCAYCKYVNFGQFTLPCRVCTLRNQ